MLHDVDGDDDDEINDDTVYWEGARLLAELEQALEGQAGDSRDRIRGAFEAHALDLLERCVLASDIDDARKRMESTS